MIIDEKPLAARILIETGAWSGSAWVWTDETSKVINATYDEGGRIGPLGSSQVDTGTLSVLYRNISAVPAIGSLIRIRRAGTSEYIFTGYIQDVGNKVTYDYSTGSTVITLTTLYCLDWVGYTSQFQVAGVGGLSAAYVVQDNYPFQSRARALNNIVDNTNNTALIGFSSDTLSSDIGNTTYSGTMSDHLDLTARTQNLIWYGTHTIPTNPTTGRTGLVNIRPGSAAVSSTKTFIDVTGSAGQLHYTEIDFESSSFNIANNIILRNSSSITSTNSEVTKIGGVNKANYEVINGVEVVAVPYEREWQAIDATSITNYGIRRAEIETNLAGVVSDLNLVSNPSLEYGDDGWSTGANRMARRRPLDNGVSFSAANGQWALRYRLATGGATTPSFRYSGSENDGIPIIAGVSYSFQASGARGSGTNTDTRVRAYIEWQDNAGAVISTIRGAQVTLPTLYVWGVATVAGFAPALAERAIVGLEYNRSGGGTFSTGDQTWLDAAIMRKSTSTTPITYFDGDTDSDGTSICLWTGAIGNSPTFKVNNLLDDYAATYLAAYSTTSNRVTRIRWNAQEDLTAVYKLTVGSTTQVTYNGTTTNHRIIGISASLEYSRYVIDYYLVKI